MLSNTDTEFIAALNPVVIPNITLDFQNAMKKYTGKKKTKEFGAQTKCHLYHEKTDSYDEYWFDKSILNAIHKFLFTEIRDQKCQQ